MITAVVVAVVGCADDAAGPADADNIGDIAGDSGIDTSDVFDDTDLTAPNDMTIGRGGLILHVVADPFSFQLFSPENDLLLSTLDVSVDTNDPVEGSYGPLAATQNTPEYDELITDGWYNYAGVDSPWLGFDHTVSSDLDTVTGSATIVLGSATGATLTVRISTSDNRVLFSAEIDPEHRGEFNRLTQSFTLEQEHMFGLGGRLTSVDHVGQSLYCWAEEDGLGLGEDQQVGPNNPSPNGPSMTGYPIPFVLSSAGYGLWLDSSYRSQFHLGSHDPAYWRVEAGEPRLSYTIYVNRDPMRTLRDFTNDVGRAIVPPLWAFGPRRQVDPEVEIEGMTEWEALREADVPTTIIEDGVRLHPQGQQRGVEVEVIERNADLSRLGYRVLAVTSPHLSTTDLRVLDDYDTAVQNDWFIADAGGVPLEVSLYAGESQVVSILDLTNPDAHSWYQAELSDALALGYSGWTVDFGEYLPDSAVLYDSRTGWEAHNLFPVLLQQTVADVLFSDPEAADNYTFVVRSGYLGSAAIAPIMRSGSPNGSFDAADGLPAVVRQALNLGFSGIPYYGADIGGVHYFNDPAPNQEDYLRWTQFGALSPAMHAENEGVGSTDARTRHGLWTDELTVEVYRRYARLHTRLAVYLHSLAVEANTTGAPLIRHPYLVHPNDPETAQIDDQYFLGSALLVAPVVESGAVNRSVYFPEGTYLNWDTGEVYFGPVRQTVDAPVERIPLFLVADQILPLLDAEIDTLVVDQSDDVVSLAERAELLDVRIAVANGSASFTMADGTTLDIQITGPVRGPFMVGDTELEIRFTPEEAATCLEGCHLETNDRLWLTSPLTENLLLTGQNLTITAVNPPGQPRRIRWEVIWLPELVEDQ